MQCVPLWGGVQKGGHAAQGAPQLCSKNQVEYSNEMNPRDGMWESEGLYLDGDAFYAALIDEIESANCSVDMEVYTFDAGVLAGRLCESFQRAHLRGVRVRLIFDH